MRVCSKCKCVKGVELFGKNKNRPDGLNLWCKVSGLHVAENLQLLLREDNRAKGNRFTPQ